MAWKTVTNLQGTDIKKHQGEAFVGEYTGHDKITTKIGEQQIFKFRDENGNPFSIYGFTNLNRAMEAITAGTMCRITYTGTENVQTKFGMKDVHQVRVEIDTDDVQEQGKDEAEPF